MFLIKLVIWITVYPIFVFSYFCSTLFECIAFLFNSPVDIWNIISKNVDEATVENDT